MTADEPDRAEAWAERFGDRVTTSQSFGELTVDVPSAEWVTALTFARDDLSCGYFDWLTGVDELEDGFGIVAHVYSLETGLHLLVRTRVPRDEPVLASATGVYRGANWHERETFEMFGVVFDGHPNLKPLLLPDGFEGHPLRKEFVLAARVAKPWPGAKEPGESASGAPSRRRMLPPGVPDDWEHEPEAKTEDEPEAKTRDEPEAADGREAERRDDH
jgi:NADH-quinone oxidoreductase subunit C